jgi:hypothetical protein
MKKAELVIESRPDEEILAGHCSSCPTTAQFRFRGNTLKHKELMRSAFDKHFQRVHMHEDANQAAARTVREATENQ